MFRYIASVKARKIVRAQQEQIRLARLTAPRVLVSQEQFSLGLLSDLIMDGTATKAERSEYFQRIAARS